MSEHNYREVWQYAMNQIQLDYRQKGKETEFKLWFNLDYVEDTLRSITVAVASDFLWQTMIKKGNIELIQKKIEELTGQPNIEIKSIIKNTSVITSYGDESKTTPKEEIYESTEFSPRNTPEFYQQEPEKSQTAHENYQKIQDNPQTEQENYYKNPIEKQNIHNASFKKHPQLRTDYTFDSFVPGDNSMYAYNASIAAAKNPGKAYNPILLYGGVGLGKTHLMQAIGNYIYRQKGDEYKICYVSAESFTNEFTSSIGNKTIDKFKAKYRKLDVLLLDDIHFLQGKEMTQEELFHTFNALYDSNSQMVFTCDRPITELKGIADRLKTRFSRGLSIDLKPPSYETRHAILLKKLEIMGKTIPEDVVSYIAKNVVTNVRDLEASLTKMIGYSELINKKLTVEIAQDQLRDTFSSPLSGTITIENIQKVIADHYSISVSDIKSKKRDKKFVVPRQIALYIARELTEYSFPELGNEFGGRDHTTAMHSYSKIESQLKTDSSLNATVQLLIREIKDYKK